jgi:hypothetical protein
MFGVVVGEIKWGGKLTITSLSTQLANMGWQYGNRGLLFALSRGWASCIMDGIAIKLEKRSYEKISGMGG